MIVIQTERSTVLKYEKFKIQLFSSEHSELKNVEEKSHVGEEINVSAGTASMIILCTHTFSYKCMKYLLLDVIL